MFKGTIKQPIARFISQSGTDIKAKSISDIDLASGVIDIIPFDSGGYFTVIPFSDYEYRQKHKTRASATYGSINGYTVFIVTDDWGSLYKIFILEVAETIGVIAKNKSYVDRFFP